MSPKRRCSENFCTKGQERMCDPFVHMPDASRTFLLEEGQLLEMMANLKVFWIQTKAEHPEIKPLKAPLPFPTLDI